MLHIEALSKTYDNGVQALNDVNLEIPCGLFGLLGPNGAGKSSLMRTIATLQESDKGRIRFDGIDVAGQPLEIRKLLGYLPQDFGVYPQFSAETMLTHFAALKGISNGRERKEMVEGLLVTVNLWEARNRKLGTYSGGMLQRFGVAQALLGNPRLVIVDEPAAGLDPEERDRLLNLLAEIGEEVVIILSTHLVANVQDLCRNMAMLVGGRVVAQGEPEHLMAELKGRVWSRVVEKREVAGYKQEHQVLSARLYAGRIAMRVKSADCPGDGFKAVTPSLEDVYFAELAKAK